MVPLPYRVVGRREETADTVTLDLVPVDEPIPDPRPGQFTMLYAFGIGEVPISVSGSAGDAGIVHTLRSVGAVTGSLCRTALGQVVGVRGPYGVGWRLPAPPGSHLLMVAGGIGLAPLRPAVRHAIDHRDRYASATVLVGARSPADLLYTDDYATWRSAGIDVGVTVDRADSGWPGHVGLVTTLVEAALHDPARTMGYTCGPEVMMRLAARRMTDCGVPAGSVDVSLERNMRCGVALCGHCQLGPLLVCRDGPVVGYDLAGPLLGIREL
jgi:anaerobic sulfite reductase subunit B